MASEQRKIRRGMAKAYLSSNGVRRFCRSETLPGERGHKIGKNARGNKRRSFSVFAGSWRQAADLYGELKIHEIRKRGRTK